MAAIIRDTYDKSKRQNKVVFQDKKPLLNYELNLLQDILNEKSVNTTNLGFGDNFVEDGFTVYPSAMINEIFIKKGIFYHKGYPIELTEDVRINNLTTPTSDRLDLIYAEWYIDEVDGTDDPSIIDSNLGLETSVQERIVLEIKIRENAVDTATNSSWYTSNGLPVPQSIIANPTTETVTFDNSNKTIKLDPLSGNIFPDWLLNNFPTGVTFTTSDPKNPGPFTVNANSTLLDKKTLVVNETLNDTIPYNTVSKLTFYDSNSEKSWTANRRNFFNIAHLNRLMGNNKVTPNMISDVREKTVYNYIIEGCRIDPVVGNPQAVMVNPGRLIVGDVEHFIEPGNENLDFSQHPPISGVSPVIGSLSDNTLNFVFINKEGYLECTQEEPLDYHVLLAEVYTDGGAVHSIIDRRKYIPFSWKNKYQGSSGEGETGFPTITHPFTAAENLGAYQVVTVVPGSTENIIKTSAVESYPNPVKLPAIGVTGQAMALGQRDNVITFGEIRNPAWNFLRIGQPVFVDVALGMLTQTPPSIQGTYVQSIGIAVTSDILFVNVGQFIIKNNPAKPFDTNFLVKRADGLIEESGAGDTFSPDKMSFLTSVAQEPIDTSFDIYPGRVFVSDTETLEYSGETISLSAGTYQTSPLTTDYFNKAFFTLDDSGIVKMYESLEQSSSASVLDPEIPDNELPISMVTFQDNGDGIAGSIRPITQDNISDRRSWLNLGNLDATSFKPVYRDNKDFIVQKGGGWFNNHYLTSSNNVVVTADTTLSGPTYYIYLDIHNATGSVSSGSFTTMISTPSQVDKRRYVPLGEYDVDPSGDINRNNFKAYLSKFWQYRNVPYVNEENFNLSVAGDTALTLSNFTFSSTDYLEITINGRDVYEGEDYIKVAPNLINFNYLVKKGAKVKVRKV